FSRNLSLPNELNLPIARITACLSFTSSKFNCLSTAVSFDSSLITFQNSRPSSSSPLYQRTGGEILSPRFYVQKMGAENWRPFQFLALKGVTLAVNQS
ncbi:MAG: hypothetical protein NZ811_01905, partial [Gammaproteobacteria bacterium]|nr:hypothetical protein [Gammaproteobacteria bacterium]